MKIYNKSQHDSLKFKFIDSELIENNYSQAYQDMFVLSVLNGKKEGTFLEIGAYDPHNLSNTYLLEKNYNWKGVSIDINPVNYDGFLNRKNTKLIVDNALNINYQDLITDNNLPNRIDYLQIDIEPQNQTLECLKLIPLDKFRFSVITFETDLYDPSVDKEESLKNREESRQILKSYGYELIVGNICNVSTNDPFEDWYVDSTFFSSDDIEKFKNSSEYNNTAESYMLNI
jgi:hypothetical protein